MIPFKKYLDSFQKEYKGNTFSVKNEICVLVKYKEVEFEILFDESTPFRFKINRSCYINLESDECICRNSIVFKCNYEDRLTYDEFRKKVILGMGYLLEKNNVNTQTP